MKVFGVMCACLVGIACAMIGYKLGMARRTAEEDEPVDNLVESVDDVPVQEEDKATKSRFETIMRNIDRYDGTAEGQEEVPWR